MTFFTIGCFNTNYAGDGFCDDENNNADCNYDGGDCCLLDVNSEHCSECVCYHQETCIAGVHPLVGDGLCHDENNNADCNYDGGDCCLLIRNKDHCSECVCSTAGVITSPGFPQKYGNELNLNWIIQVPDGQFVHTTFISFDVEGGSSCK